jgi:hypothetical protein
MQIGKAALASIRAGAIAGYDWPAGMDAARAPLHDLASVLDVDSLRRQATHLQTDKQIAVTFISSEYLGVGRIWLAAMKHLGLSNYLVIAGDPQARDTLAGWGAPHVEARLLPRASSCDYVSRAGFSAKGLAMTALKFPVVRALLESGLDVVLSDADAMWLRDPVSHLQADIAFQRVCYFPSPVADFWGFAACSGFVFVRASQGCVRLLDDCIQEQTAVQSDQLALNLALLEAGSTWDASAAEESTRPLAANERLRNDFVAKSRVGIGGRIDRYGLKLLALPHHQFWRHAWVPAAADEMVICHPNSPKNDIEKQKSLAALGFPLHCD